jgi:hypothetical protein
MAHESKIIDMKRRPELALLDDSSIGLRPPCWPRRNRHPYVAALHSDRDHARAG